MGRLRAGVLAGVLAASAVGLVEPGCMPVATRQQLDRLEVVTVIVLGGTATVSDAAAEGRATCR